MKKLFKKEGVMHAVCEFTRGNWIIVGDIDTRQFFIYTSKRLAEDKKKHLDKKWETRKFKVLFVDINIWEGNFKKNIND